MPAFTAEQIAILDAVRDTNDSLLISARAGSGKTFVLKQAVNLLRGSTAVLAFNRAIADELKAKISPTLSGAQSFQTDISTAHSAGLRAFKKMGRNPKTLSGKVSFILKDLLKTAPDDDDIQRNARHVSKLVSHAKNHGFGITSTFEQFPSIDSREAYRALIDHFDMSPEIEGDTTEDDLIDWAIRVLKLSNARIDSIDFDDMIYLPLLLNFTMQQYDNVLVDEAQDINGTRRELLFRMLKPGGRMIAVGDPYQAIYGFTGADVASLQKIRDRAGAMELKLTTCFRCDKAIITKAQEIVPDIRWREDAGEGQFRAITWDTNEIDFLSLPRAGDAILCRLNKPNVAVCLGLIRRGVPARIEGRDIGNRLLDHVKRSTPMYSHQPLSDTLIDLANYKEAETAKLFAKNREAAADMLQDEVEAAELIIERVMEEGREIGQGSVFANLELKINEMFGDQIQPNNVVTLSSIHKSKGREWKVVYILGRNDYMPFHRAVKTGGWALTQEYNLMYVGDTRAERILIHVNGVQSAIDRGLHRKGAK